MTMTNDAYRDHVYTESFEDTLRSFDQYVQESTVLIIAGIATFVALLIALIRKIFFAKKTAQGSSDSVYLVYTKIEALLDQKNIPRKITVKKGVDLNAPESFIDLKDTIEKYNAELEKFLENPNYKVLSSLLMEANQNKNKATMETAQRNFVQRTYDTGELRGFIKRKLVMYKEAAGELKRMDKLQKQIEKKTAISQSNREILSDAYKGMVEIFNFEKKMNNEWYKNIKAGINEGLAER